MTDKNWNETVITEAGSTQSGNTAPLEPPTSLSPGVVIGKYRILQKLSEGGMGAIYLCHPMDDAARRLVLKVLKNEAKAKTTGKKTLPPRIRSAQRPRPRKHRPDFRLLE